MAELKQFGFTILNFFFLVISTVFFLTLMLPFIKIPSFTLPIILAIYFVPFIWAIIEHFILSGKDFSKSFHLEIFISVVFAEIFLLILGYIYLITGV